MASGRDSLIDRLEREGLRRLGSKERGFRYAGPGRRRVAKADLDRIRRLRLPPAWTDVRIDPSPAARVQAIGRNRAGRVQYRYHEDWVARRERRKYEHLVRFARALPRLRRQVDRDLDLPGLDRRRVLAAIVRILERCFLRPGSQRYAHENGSIGLATLRPKHVRVRGDVVRFEFPAKNHKPRECELRGRRVARVVRDLLRVPGKEVFKFRDGSGEVVDVRRRTINRYLKEAMGEPFRAKDFRTWAGTLAYACALARAGADAQDGPRARRGKAVAAVKETAALLGNTPAVCRASYIFPAILEGFQRGRVIERSVRDLAEIAARRSPALHPVEKATLALIEREAAAARAVGGPGLRTALERSVRMARSRRADRRRLRGGVRASGLALRMR